MHGVDLVNLLVMDVFTLLRLRSVSQPEILGTFSVSQLTMTENQTCTNSQQADKSTTTQHGCDLNNSATPSDQLYTHYLFMYFDLLALKIIISNACHETNLNMKKNSFVYCHIKDLVMKVNYLWLFFINKKNAQCSVIGIIFLLSKLIL